MAFMKFNGPNENFGEHLIDITKIVGITKYENGRFEIHFSQITFLCEDTNNNHVKLDSIIHSLIFLGE